MPFRVVNVEQLHPDPHLGPLKHDHKLTLIFFSLDEGYFRNENPWMKRGDPTVIWPRDWLPKEEEGLGDNILVLYVWGRVRPAKESWLNMANDLVRDLVMNTRWQLDRPQTIVLVGHGVGGLMLKSLTMEVDKVSKVDKANGELQKARCKAFQQNVKGIVFYSVPHTTSEEECANYWKSYPNKYMSQLFFHLPKLFTQDMVSFNVGFEKSIEQQDINLFAFVEGQKVSISQSSTYKLTQNNVCKIEDADYIHVHEPLDQQHDSYKRLLQFTQEALDADELRLQQSNTKFNLKDSQRKAKQEVKTSTETNEIEGVPSQQQKLDVMIRTIDVRIKTPKDLGDLAPKEVLGKTSIVCVGGKAMKGDLGEFLFMHVGDMAKVVGVGLDWAKVVVTKEFGVNVIQEDEGMWTKLWCLEHFVPRIITIPNPKQKLVTHPNSAKTDGVELETHLGCVYVEDDKEENAHACFPLVFELAEHIGLGRKNAMKVKEVSRAKSSGSTKGGEVSRIESSGSTKGEEVLGAESSGSTKGGEVSGAESSGSTKGGEASRAKSSGSKQEIRRNEDDEGSEDPSKGPPDPSDPSLSVGPRDEEERTLIVKVYPKGGELSIALKGQKKPPSIIPILVFKFQKKKCREINVEAEAQCNFGRMERTETGFGYYQDNITISLNCEDEDPGAATVSKPHVQNVEYVKKTMTDTSTTIKNSGYQIGCGIGVDVMPHATRDYAVNFQGNLDHTSSGGTNSTQGSNNDVLFVQLGRYHVNDLCIQKEMTYDFQYPQHILQQIASSDSSEIKTENTFQATIVGNWENLNIETMSPYVFFVERHIVSKEILRGSKKPVGNPCTRIEYKVRYDSSIKQSYKVELKVNHAMTHMPHEVNTPLSETRKILKIENVMEISPSTSETI